MKNRASIISVLSFMACCLYTSTANSVAVRSLQITDWDMRNFGMVFLWDYKDIFEPVEMGTYQGTPSFLASGAVDFSTAILGGSLNCRASGDCSSLAVFTSPDYGNQPSGDVSSGTLSLDLSSWAVYISNPNPLGGGGFVNFVEAAGSAPVNSWSTPVSTTYDSASRFFTADWDYVDNRTGSNSAIYSWRLEGYVQLVPLPGALLLFISGILVLFGFHKRRYR